MVTVRKEIALLTFFTLAVAPASGAVDSAANGWMAGKVGAFAHYLPNSATFKCVDDFDVPGLADRLKAMKADYFLLTLGQNSGYYCAPNETYEKTAGYAAGSRCAKRDLPAEIIAALKGTSIRFGLYLPCQPANEDVCAAVKFGLAAEGVNGGTDRFITAACAERWAKVIREWAVRYGDGVSLWWFDGAYAWCGFCDDIAVRYKEACRLGNPKVQVAFNGGVRQLAPESQSDYWAGEENEPLSVVPHAGRWYRPGVQWQVLTPQGLTWAWSDCRFRDAQLKDWLYQCTSRGGMCTLEMKIDIANGHLDRCQSEQFARIREAGGPSAGCSAYSAANGWMAAGGPGATMKAYFDDAMTAYAPTDGKTAPATVITRYSREDPFGVDGHEDLPAGPVVPTHPIVYGIPGLRNVRDIGGWTGLRTGRILRGSQLMRTAGFPDGIDPRTRSALVGELDIVSDLDLRGVKEWGVRDFGHTNLVELQELGIAKVSRPFPSYLGLLTHTNVVAAALRDFANRANYPVYVHCAGGADRTGSLILLLEALCGVPEYKIDIDYELTSFAKIYGLRHRDETERLNWKSFKDALRTKYPASDLNGSVLRFVMEGVGLTFEDVARIRSNLL